MRRKPTARSGATPRRTRNRGQCYNLVGYPQDQRNCTKCHDGSATKSDGSVNANQTKDGDNWMKVPSRLACGACHDGIDFATGQGNPGQPRCRRCGPVGRQRRATSAAHSRMTPSARLCHDATSIPVYHRTTVASLNNPVVKAGVASFAYKISSVTINSAKQVVVKFQILKNGAAVALNAYAAGAVPVTGYTGGPSFQVAYATGQDGIAAPDRLEQRSRHADAGRCLGGRQRQHPDRPRCEQHLYRHHRSQFYRPQPKPQPGLAR